MNEKDCSNDSSKSDSELQGKANGQVAGAGENPNNGSQADTNSSTENWELALDLVVERWEVLFANGNELSVDVLCEHDDELSVLAEKFPGLVEAAEAEIDKLKRFENAFGDLVETPTMHLGLGGVGKPLENGIVGRVGPHHGQYPNQEMPTDPEPFAALGHGDSNQGDSNQRGSDPAGQHQSEASFGPIHKELTSVRNVSDESHSSSLQKSHESHNVDSGGESKTGRRSQDGNRIRSGTELEADGHLTIESHLDQGGLGDVYRASDDSLRRPVAVKLIKDYAKNRHYTSRFLREAAVTAQLDGPGVVPIHGCGTADDGQPFYVMRLIDGDGLDQKIKQFHAERAQRAGAHSDSVEFQRLLRYFLSVCRTVTYAHDMGVVHCDLKPQNIKIGRYEEVFVLDWGEATSCGSRLDVPKHHSGRVSPAYAPPELLTGTKSPSPATDIYSLGVILYEILLGRRAAEDPPGERESHLKSSHVPPALASICRKGLKIASESRYRSVRDMTADIERWLADEAVEVHRYSLRERFSLSLRRYTTLAQIAGVVVTCLLVLSLFLAARLQVKNAQQERTHVRTLMVSAGLSSDRIADELHRRFVFLDTLGREINKEESLLESVTASHASGDKQALLSSELMTWFNQRLDESGTPEANSWFILDRSGYQIAKQAPDNADRSNVLSSLGKYYGYRDYFHGSGYDREKGLPKAEEVQPIEAPYICRRYTSSTTKKLRVALTCPLFDRAGEVIGVIGMSFNLDDLSFVSNRLNEEESLILVDMRASAEKHAPGAIVVHPRYRESLMDGYQVEHRQVSDESLKLFREVQERRRVQYENRIDDARLPSVDNHITRYRDPVDKDSVQMHAAFEPVFIEYRDKWMATGLVVLVRGQLN